MNVGSGGEEMSNAELNYPKNVVIGKDVPGFENLYMALTNGQIWSYTKRCYMSQFKDKRGYMNVELYKDGKTYHSKVHRLVLSAFVPQPKGKDQVNHIDGIKNNNNLNNLEWVTGKENMQHSFSMGLEKGRKGEEHNMAKLTNEDVLTIRKLYAGGITDSGKKYSQRELARMYGLRQSTIWGILHRKNWSHI